jgi:hypothetical protein
VLIARFGREPLEGFAQDGFAQPHASWTAPSLSPGDIVQHGHVVELLSPAGTVTRIPLSEIKLISFIRDFGGGETWRKHRSFQSRPKAPGLWIRLRFRDGDTLEGTAPNNLMQMEPLGISLTPPDPTFQNQRIFAPRAALSSVEVLGVIGSPLRRPKVAQRGQRDGELQMEMFEER